jgi:Flp pilus assembly protein TadG
MREQRKCAPIRRGTATVELAVILPLLILLVVIGVDFARVYYFDMALINAARTGAQYASAHPDNVAKTEEIKKVVLADTKNLSPDPEVDIKTATEDGIPYVTVTVTWNFYTVVDYPGVARPLTLTRSVKMRVIPANPKESGT